MAGGKQTFVLGESGAGGAGLAAEQVDALSGWLAMRAVRMHVAVVDFGWGGGADGDDLDVEGEVDAGKGVVGVNRDVVAIDTGDGGDGLAGGGLRLKLHPQDEVRFRRELRAAGLDDEGRVVKAVGFGGGNVGDEGITSGSSLELFFQSADNILVAMQVSERLASFAGIDDLTGGIGQFVVHGDNRVMGDLHEEGVAGRGMLDKGFSPTR